MQKLCYLLISREEKEITILRHNVWNNTERIRTPVAFMIIPQHLYCYLHILYLQFKTLKAFIRRVLSISGVHLPSIKSMFFLFKSSNLVLFLNICYQLPSVVKPTQKGDLFFLPSDPHEFCFTRVAFSIKEQRGSVWDFLAVSHLGV